MNRQRRFYQRFLATSMVICLLCMALAYVIRTDFGKVKIKEISIVDGNGNKIAATMFIPKTADRKSVV